MAQSTLRHPKVAMRELGQMYEISDEEEVLVFLKRYPETPPLLIEIRNAIPRYFGDDPVRLDLFYDPELEERDPDPALFANILTSSDDALARLKRFDHDWWLGKLKEARAPLVVSIHHVQRV